jgi:hypothetical protein
VRGPYVKRLYDNPQSFDTDPTARLRYADRTDCSQEQVRPPAPYFLSAGPLRLIEMEPSAGC